MSEHCDHAFKTFLTDRFDSLFPHCLGCGALYGNGARILQNNVREHPGIYYLNRFARVINLDIQGIPAQPVHNA